MAFFRGEEGSVKFKNGTGTTAAIVSTTGWTLDTSKETLDVTAHGDTFRKNVGSLVSGSGTVDLLYTAPGTGETQNLVNDVLTAEDPADAQFELFLNGSNKVTFNAVVTGTTLSTATGDLETVSVSFITSGAITNAA